MHSITIELIRIKIKKIKEFLLDAKLEELDLVITQINLGGYGQVHDSF